MLREVHLATFHLPYGKTHLTFALPDGLDVQLLAPRDVAGAADELAAVTQALAAPVGGSPLADRLATPIAGRPSVAIAINDKTRPVPHKYLLPPLLAQLEALGVPPAAITLVIATGTHAPMSPEEFGQVVPPEILGRYPIISHDCDAADLMPLGKTRRGVAVRANRRFMAADLRIVVGNIEPHQFMGWSGGVKSAAVGLSGRATINANHALMTAPGAELGHYDDNPMRQEVEEIGQMMEVGFALNAILNDRKEIVHALAGDPVSVMRQGIPLARGIYQVAVAEPFDLLIISPGGHPKDLNIYQAQKALGHATLAMRPGGTVIWAAACPDGTGSRGYEEFMADSAMTSYAAVLARYAAEGYHLGPHKAWQIARDASRIRLISISDIAPDFARRLLLNPVADRAGMTAQDQLTQAMSAILPGLPPHARIGVMPWANATIPLLSRGPQTS
ncbi:MAG: lactate racemase [Chloroflexota bacterium]|nr:lactate racemase [Chloroflexota bacterium]